MNKYIGKILKDWMLESKTPSAVQFKYSFSNGMLTLYTKYPGYMIGKAGCHAIKYLEIFKNEFHNFNNFDFQQVDGCVEYVGMAKEIGVVSEDSNKSKCLDIKTSSIMDIVYGFLSLSFIRKTDILLRLDLLNADERSNINKIKYVNMLDDILLRINEKNCMNEFIAEINKGNV